MKSKFRSRLDIQLACLLPICFVLASPLVAQNASTDTPGAFTSVSLVAVGDPPEPRFMIAGSKMKLQSVPEAEYPPTMLYVPKADEKGKKDLITLGLNLPGKQVKLKGTKSLCLMESIESGGETAYREWTTVKLPVMNEELAVFLYRSGPSSSWRKSPQSMVLRNGPLAFPARHFRLVNLSKRVLTFRIEDATAFSLQPMEVKVLPAGQREYCSYSAAYKDGENLKIVAQQQACSMHADSRVTLVAYDSDTAAKSGRPPVTLRRFYELPTPPKVAEGAGAPGTVP